MIEPKTEERDVRELVATVLRAGQALRAVLDDEEPVPSRDRHEGGQIDPATEEVGHHQETTAWSDHPLEGARAGCERRAIDVYGYGHQPVGLRDPDHVWMGDRREHDLVAGSELEALDQKLERRADGQTDDSIRVAPSAQNALLAGAVAGAQAGERSEQKVCERDVEPMSRVEPASRRSDLRS